MKLVIAVKIDCIAKFGGLLLNVRDLSLFSSLSTKKNDLGMAIDGGGFNIRVITVVGCRVTMLG